MEKQVQTKMRIAARLDDKRKELGWSVKDMSKVFNKSPHVIKYWLSGTYNWTINTLVIIEQVMDINLIDKTIL
jgi:ribosome-binding protein aMBF1 (putative translation factor)